MKSYKPLDSPTLIQGDLYQDARGQISFINEFDMSLVRRQYQITPKDSGIVRAWQGHVIEQKWFQALAGSFLVRLIPMFEMNSKSKRPTIIEYILKAKKNNVLHIPGGYANGFQAIAPNSRLMVFSNTALEKASTDDYRYPSDYESYWKIVNA